MPHVCRLVALIALILASSPSRAAVPEAAIKRAVDRGVAALRRGMGDSGQLPGGLYTSGATSLAALTLLECGVRPDDEQLRKAVAAVRADCPTMNRVYPIALAIMLLNRLGDPADGPLIRVLAVRLLEGQKPEGGWHYTTPDVPPDEAERVRDLVRRRAELKTAPGESGPALPSDLVERVGKLRTRQNGPGGLDVDNSNTQVAVLAAWVARRHGVPADFALRRAEAYFRATHVNGVWPYAPTGFPEDRPANTCAGLLGLAIGAGVVREAQMKTWPEGKNGRPPTLRDPLKDPLVQTAMNYVGPRVAQTAAAGLEPEFSGSRTLYFLWSVERVGMVYGVAVMGGVDWYQAGATAILRAQQADGSWPDRATGLLAATSQVNTCFALLFLKRSNFATDLTADLRPRPKQAALHADGGKAAPPPEAEVTAAERLAGELPSATPPRQAAVLAELRGGKGSEYTAALAHVIPKLAGDVQRKARDALAERLARMTVATVRAKLKDADAEVRRAAALACAMKEDKGLIPDLIAVLDDADAWVVRAAAVALRTLTGQDFGPAANAAATERAKAVAAWKAWWKQQPGR
ncbi:MAG TPA: HEAT repeat domain-containing protein [Gemmataceae bacterium]